MSLYTEFRLNSGERLRVWHVAYTELNLKTKFNNMENDNLKTEKQCAIHDVMARLFDEVTKKSNADRSRVVAGYNKGKLCFYELDLHEETVKRYLTTVSLNVP